MLVGRAAVRPDVAPRPQLGPQQTVVYLIFLSPRGKTQYGMVWLLSGLLAHCQACGAALMGSGVLAGWIRKVHRGGRSRLPCGRGPAAPGGRQADPLEGWIHRSTALGVCVVQAISVTGNGSLWNFGWGMGGRVGAGQCLCSLLS